MNKVTLTGILLTAITIAGCGNGAKSSNNDQSQATAEVAKPIPHQKNSSIFLAIASTAGYGLDDQGDAFPGVIGRRVDSLKLPYKVVNAGLSGETTAGGNGRINWLLKQKIDIFVLELGANDGLRGIPVNETAKNLQSIVDKVKAKYPDAKLILLGMQVPPNMGADYSNKFKSVFPTLAAKNKMELVPFLLQGVAGIPSLNQGDGIHPTAQGAKIVADNVWTVLKTELK